MKINIKLITGLSLVLMAIVAMLALSLSEKINLQILAWTAIIVLDMIAAWGLYYVFKDTYAEVSLLSAILRITYAAILAIATSALLVSKLAPSEEVGFYQEIFEAIWSWGLIIFGLHLLLIGALSKASSLVPNWLSYTLLLGGLGYLIVCLLELFLGKESNITSNVEMLFMAPMIVGELGLAILLILKRKA